MISLSASYRPYKFEIFREAYLCFMTTLWLYYSNILKLNIQFRMKLYEFYIYDFFFIFMFSLKENRMNVWKFVFIVLFFLVIGR